MAQLIPCDLHVHPDYSIDSDTGIEKFCAKACWLNIPVIGFTTHYDINPIYEDTDAFMVVDSEKVKVDDYAVGRYVDDCLVAREQFPELNILIGLEVDYFPGVEAEVYRLKNEFAFDYLIGSVHNLNGIGISDQKEAPKFFSTNSLDKMAETYFNLLYHAANCGLFTVLGHADYYLRYGALYYGQSILKIHREYLSKVVEAAIRTNTGFEINTSYRRHGGDLCYPQPDFVQSADKLGAIFNAIGSDSHTANHLGAGIPEAIRAINDIGVKLKLFYENG